MELIQTPTILGEVVIILEGPGIDILREVWIIGVHKKKDSIIMKVDVGEGKEVLDAVRRLPVPH